ncbi:MAG: hypothetical protein NTV22_08390 [bacterium]|nr:hypothetical protein [bacterium]
MPSSLNSRERVILALSRKQPDRVPCAPDISNMVPCRLTGKPFWNVLLDAEPPIWQAYLDAARHFDIDAFFFHAAPGDNPRARYSARRNVTRREDDRVVTETVYTTPAGEFREEWTFPVGDSETCTRKAFQTMHEALPHLQYILSADMAGDFAPTRAMQSYINGEFAVGGYCNTPMLPYHWLVGQLEEAVVEYYDEVEIMHQYRELFHNYNVRKTEMFLDFGVDFLLIESSGSLTMQSLDIVRDMQLPTLKVLTAMCRQAGVPSMFHSCGRSRPLLPMLADETELDGVQPLECPPTGDIDLLEVKRTYGQRLCLMGNLNTPELMLRGTADDVYNESVRLLNGCKQDGAFILSTGDQCGRDTPDENIHAMRRACLDHGGY